MPASPRASDPTTARPHRSRLLAAGLAVALAAGGTLLVDRVRHADEAAAATVQQQASSTLLRDVETLRATLADPARDGQATATALLRHQLSVLSGEVVDDVVADRLLAQLRSAADRLEDASTTPLPERPNALAVATVDPVFTRLDGLEGQASAVATRLREAADEAEAFHAPLVALLRAAEAYAEEADLDTDRDPDATAAAWREERARLADYRDAVRAAEAHPVLAPLAEAHALLVDGMRRLAKASIEDLEAGDLDTYNQRLADTLGEDDPFGFARAVEDAQETVAVRWVESSLQQARAHALGLLTELDELRRLTPAQLDRA